MCHNQVECTWIQYARDVMYPRWMQPHIKELVLAPGVQSRNLFSGTIPSNELSMTTFAQYMLDRLPPVQTLMSLPFGVGNASLLSSRMGMNSMG